MKYEMALTKQDLQSVKDNAKGINRYIKVKSIKVKNYDLYNFDIDFSAITIMLDKVIALKEFKAFMTAFRMTIFNRG